jgi:hypothetical protein
MNGWKTFGISVIVFLIALGIYAGFNSYTNSQFERGYIKGWEQSYQNVLLNQTKTGNFYYTIDETGYPSIKGNLTIAITNSTSIIQNCILYSGCTWNQTKYEMLNKK